MRTTLSSKPLTSRGLLSRSRQDSGPAAGADLASRLSLLFLSIGTAWIAIAGRFSTELFERYQRSEKALVSGAGRDVRARRVDAQVKAITVPAGHALLAAKLV
jgi:hypothetical protein